MEGIIEHFKNLVSINGPSFSEKEIAEYLVTDLEKLNFKVKIDNSGDKKGNTGNVIGFRDGIGEPILLSAHMDTVEPTEGIVIVDEDGKISTDGSTILGADDRAGVLAIIEGIKSADEEGIKTRPLEVVFTIAEEVGLIGAKGLETAEIKSKHAFVFDSGGDVGTVIYKAPSEIDFSAQIHGKAAHSGVNPEDGISAIKIAGHIIAELPLGRLDEETTANIGIITGGKSTNVVCPLVEMKGEVRSHTFSKAENIHDKFKQTFEKYAKEFGGKLDWHSEVIYKNFEITEDCEIMQKLIKAFDKVGVKLQRKPRGGGSDANILNNKGITTVNLGIGMEKGHSKEEYITHENLKNSVLLVKALVEVEEM